MTNVVVVNFGNRQRTESFEQAAIRLLAGIEDRAARDSAGELAGCDTRGEVIAGGHSAASIGSSKKYASSQGNFRLMASDRMRFISSTERGVPLSHLETVPCWTPAILAKSD